MPSLFQFGTFPELSLAELISRAPILIGGKTIAKKFYLTRASESPSWLMQNLGGIVKIYDVLDVADTPSALAEHIIKRLTTKKKLIFGISTLNKAKNITLGLAVKRELQKTGRSVRLVTSRDNELSSVTTKMEKLLPPDGIELLILKNNDKKTLVAEVVAIQPFQEYSERDYGRPGRNTKRGMLPPKLAKIMINLAIDNRNPTHLTLFDPFCGSGTILIEATLLGVGKIIGSDIDKNAVVDTKNSVDWANKLINQTPHHSNKSQNSANSALIHIFRHDATKTPAHIKPNSIDVVVSEPFLGKPLHHGETAQLSEKNTLIALYRNALAALYPLLKHGGKVVLALPFQPKPKNLLPIEQIIQSSWFIVEPLYENLTFFEYARSDQRVGRQIIRLKKP